MSSTDQLPLRRTAPFMRVPDPSQRQRSRVGIVGIPFDYGVHAYRIGSRLGPAAIREQSLLIRPFNPPHFDFDVIEQMEVADWGDVDVVPGQIGEAFGKIETVLDAIYAAGALPIAMGGDGAVTLPQLRAAHRKFGRLAVVHLDSHNDSNPVPATGHDTGTTFVRAVQENLIDVSKSLHVGIRGTFKMPGIIAKSDALGYETLYMSDIEAMGIANVVAHIRGKCGGLPVFICLDMDFFDPSCAPGVCAPSWGGVLAREGIAIVKGLAGLNVIAMDVNTISPPHDVGGMSALLAAQMMLEGVLLFHQNGHLR